MKLFIDNHDQSGGYDYTEMLEAASAPKIRRSLNAPSTLDVSIFGEVGTFVMPRLGSTVWIEREDKSRWFTGTIDCTPQQEWLGSGLRASIVRVKVHAISDEFVLDRVPLEKSLAIAEADASETLCGYTASAGGPWFDTSEIADVGSLKAFETRDGERWSEAAARIAKSCRAAYAAENGAVSLRSIGTVRHDLSDSDETFIPEALRIEEQGRAIQDWMVVGEIGPGAYVKDYFIGDGHTMRFPMSQQPFLRPSVTWLEEEYGEALSAAMWKNSDATKISTANGKLVLAGGTGVDGAATLCATELMELGGCMVLEHGALVVNSASDGIVGGLYDGDVKLANCIAGFALSSAGASTSLQAVIDGARVGSVAPITYGHRYELTTRFYASEVYRVAQSYRWSGGEETSEPSAASIRFVMEVRDLDSSTPVPPATVIYEGVVEQAPPLATYAIANVWNMDATVAYTRIRRMPTAEVRTTSAADGSTRTRIVGLISDGAECSITTGPAVYFFAPYKPANGDQVVVRYRAAKRVSARVYEFGAALTSGAEVVRIESPMARTDEDCRRAATALLRDSNRVSCKGTYSSWSDLLENEIAPGDSLAIDAASRAMAFTAIVRDVESEVVDGANDRAKCRITFAEDGAEPIAMQLEPVTSDELSGVRSTVLDGDDAAPSLGSAEVVEITSSTVQIDAGVYLPAGGGIEVRREGDFGWGDGNDRNLVGRFTTRRFTVPRGTRSEDYYVRMFDGENPKNYSPLTTLLHVDVKDESI